MPVFYNYSNAIFGTQSTVNGNPVNYNFAPPNGGNWQWTGATTSFTVRENDGAVNFNGDPTNETISAQERLGATWEQVAEIDGAFRQIIWDYTFEISSGGTTYRVAVIDVDYNNDNDLSDAGEDGYFLVFPDGVPPAGTNFTVGNIVKNDNFTSHADLGSTVVCFAKGTLIETDRGDVAIENLALGDRIRTMDAGFQPLRWIGTRSVPATKELAPICISKGALGNTKTLEVSPNHRMLISGWRAEMFFGCDEVLVAARDLVDGDRIFRRTGGMVNYYHMLFDDHQIVFANSCPSESLHPGPMAMDALGTAARREILEIFPELAALDGPARQTARMCLKSYEATFLEPA